MIAELLRHQGGAAARAETAQGEPDRAADDVGGRGVGSLQRGLQMIAEQAKRTPKGQWVRVAGGWSPYQFTERRMPTVAELNNAAPDTPVYVLFAYSEGLLNKAVASGCSSSETRSLRRMSASDA